MRTGQKQKMKNLTMKDGNKSLEFAKRTRFHNNSPTISFLMGGSPVLYKLEIDQVLEDQTGNFIRHITVKHEFADETVAYLQLDKNEIILLFEDQLEHTEEETLKFA